AHPLAEQAGGRQLRVRRPEPPARADRSRAAKCNPRLVRWSAWSVAEHAVERVVMEHVLHPQPGYPFDLALRIDYSVSAGGLTVRTTATNVGDEPCPYGSGARPYLPLATPTRDLA